MQTVLLVFFLSLLILLNNNKIVWNAKKQIFYSFLEPDVILNDRVYRF